MYNSILYLKINGADFMSNNKNNVESLAVEESVLADKFNTVKEKATNLMDAASENFQEKTNAVKKSVKKYVKAIDEESDATQQSIVDFISEYPLVSVGVALLSGALLSKLFSK
jgi:ElaB/YqjD/DUF883 family membrane-anchored ribosome-binding protein